MRFKDDVHAAEFTRSGLATDVKVLSTRVLAHLSGSECGPALPLHPLLNRPCFGEK